MAAPTTSTSPCTKKGNRDIGTGFNDDPLWLIAGTAAYLRETGDWSILDEQVPFDNDASKAQSLMEHLRRSFNFTVTHLGPHGLPLIGRADWNDCLNLNCFSEHPGESFQITGPQRKALWPKACSLRACSSSTATSTPNCATT